MVPVASVIIDLVCDVCEEVNLEAGRTSTRTSEAIRAGSLFVGGATTVATFVWGPAGFFIGGSLGGLAMTWFYWNKFRSVVDIIRNDLTPKQKERLVERVKDCLAEKGISVGVDLAFQGLSGVVKLAILEVVKEYFQSELRMKTKPKRV
uniref:Viral responsive protein n=1 Tax=Penaeus japonicus TaxID=27405 RepID=A0A292G180_PENJP|nr:viral responsive protein [Penaeus japonicus]